MASTDTAGVKIRQPIPCVFHMHVAVTIRTSDVDAFLDAIRPVFVLASAEPDCAFFILCREDLAAEGHTRFQWTEGWTKSVERFQAEQIPKPYMQPYFDAITPMFVKPRELHFGVPVENMAAFKS